MSHNEITIIGNLGRDPEIKTTSSGVRVANLTIATNRRRKIEGEWSEETDWFDVSIFGNIVDSIEKYYVKGKTVLAVGPHVSRKYEDKNGNKRVAWEVRANTVKLIGNQKAVSDSSDRQGDAEFSDDMPF